MEISPKELCKKILTINHIGVQCDNIHDCEEMHQTIKLLDNMDKHDAIRLLMHVIHVQELQLIGADVKYDEENPFKDMVEFECMETYIKSFSPNLDTLY